MQQEQDGFIGWLSRSGGGGGMDLFIRKDCVLTLEFVLIRLQDLA